MFRQTSIAVVILGTSMLMFGCANMGSGFTPIVDKKGVNEAQYQKDLQECQGLSTETEGAGADAAKRAAGGAAVGALIGLVGGSNRTGIAQTAGVGSVIGGASGLYANNAEKQNIIRRCLSGRGYRVLN